MKIYCVSVLCCLTMFLISASVLAVPVNLSGWKVTPDSLRGETIKSGGKTVLRVNGSADDDQRWASPSMKLKQGGEYLLRFTSQSNAVGGLLPCGVGGVNRDFLPTPAPTDNSFALRLPTKTDNASIVLGAYNVGGYVDYSNVELIPVQVINTQKNGMVLGDGERVEEGQYIDIHNMGWQGSTIHRTLKQFTCVFNSHRWIIQPDSNIVYYYDVPFNMTYGQVRINCHYYVSGSVQVSISTDGSNYTKIGELSSISAGEFELPADMLPAKKLYVKISAGTDDANLQINTYQFGAKTDYQGEKISGRSLIIAEPVTSSSIGAKWVQGKDGFDVIWENKSSVKLTAAVSTAQDGVAGKSSTIVIPAGGKATSRIPVSRKLGAHTQTIKLTSGKNVLYMGSINTTTTVLQNDNYGYRLPSTVKGVNLWWCESDWKVSPERSVPKTVSKKPVSLSAAKGEYEGVQLVINPNEYGVSINGASIGSLTNGKNKISNTNVKFYEIATVPVSAATDYWGEAGDYPDPIPLLKGKLSVSKNRNQGIWVSVYVPEDAKGGVYTGKLTIKTSKGDVTAPFELTVYDFAIPKHATLRSALGLNHDAIKAYNKPINREQEMVMWDKWMKNFAEHRISPNIFYPYAPIGFSIEGEPGNRKVKLDWTAFDRAAEQFLDKYNLSSFQLSINGLGGGTFYDRQTGEIDGHKAGTPEYEKLMADYLGQLENHLREKGWLEKAYVYWFDEPEEKDYPFVIEVMQRLKKYAPGIKRLLTEQPEPPLYGNVDIWCGLTSMWSPKAINERNAAGEEVWWYICCGPQAPYVGEFIDHPGGELRLWIWQTWQYNVKGILIWTTNYWSSGAGFPDSFQNPWEDAMSYVDGYGTPKGTRLPWGNGDGRFLYPARRDPNTATETYLGDPISSIRWEALRDGMEDYEYFIILQRLINEKSGKIPAKLKADAKKLLIVPEKISKDMVTFTTDPRLILQHRNKIARMIERLSKI